VATPQPSVDVPGLALTVKPPVRSSRRRWIIGGVVLLALLLVRACHHGASTPGAFHTVAVRRGDIVESVVATGKIEPKTKVEIKAKVNGIVTALPVDAGDPVKEGQIVAELDKEVAEARVKEARAHLLAARAQAEKQRVEVTSAERDFSRQELVRQQALKQGGIISARELDKAKLDSDLADTRFASARAALAVAEAEVAGGEATLEEAENELRYATILSPLTGIVLVRPVDVGAGVSAVGSSAGFGTPIMTVGDVSQLHVVGQVDEIDIGRVVVGQPARIRVESLRGHPFAGEVTRIAPQGNEKDKVINFEIEVAVRGDATGLRSMMTADAEVIIAEKRDVLLVPEAAVVRDGEQAFVERPAPRAADGKQRAAVTLGIGNGSEVEVTDGIAEGDLIVGP
jgi:HlyD family secretion protein